MRGHAAGAPSTEVLEIDAEEGAGPGRAAEAGRRDALAHSSHMHAPILVAMNALHVWDESGFILCARSNI